MKLKEHQYGILMCHPILNGKFSLLSVKPQE